MIIFSIIYVISNCTSSVHHCLLWLQQLFLYLFLNDNRRMGKTSLSSINCGTYYKAVKIDCHYANLDRNAGTNSSQNISYIIFPSVYFVFHLNHSINIAKTEMFYPFQWVLSLTASNQGTQMTQGQKYIYYSEYEKNPLGKHKNLHLKSCLKCDCVVLIHFYFPYFQVFCLNCQLSV